MSQRASAPPSKTSRFTGKRYFTGGSNVAGSTGFAMATVGDPRTFGVQVSQNF